MLYFVHYDDEKNRRIYLPIKNISKKHFVQHEPSFLWNQKTILIFMMVPQFTQF